MGSVCSRPFHWQDAPRSERPRGAGPRRVGVRAGHRGAPRAHGDPRLDARALLRAADGAPGFF